MRVLTENDFKFGEANLSEGDTKRLHSFIRRKLIGRLVLSENTDGPNEWLLSKLVSNKNWESWPSESCRIPKDADTVDLLENTVIMIAIWKNPTEDIQVVERVFFGDTVWWIVTRKKTIANKAERIIREEERKFRVNYPLAFDKISSILKEYGLVGVIDGYTLYGCSDYQNFHCLVVIDLYLSRNIKIAVNALKSLGLSKERIKDLAVQIFDTLDRYEVLRWPCYLHSSNPDVYLVLEGNVIYTTWNAPKQGEILRKSSRI